MSSSLCMQRGSQYFPRALCSLSILCAAPADHRPPGGQGHYALSHPFIRSLVHSSLTCVLDELLSVPGPVLAACVDSWSGERSEPGRTGWYSAGPAGTDEYSAPCARQRWGGSGPAVQACWGKCPSPTSSISLSLKQPPQKGFVRSQG